MEFAILNKRSDKQFFSSSLSHKLARLDWPHLLASGKDEREVRCCREREEVAQAPWKMRHSIKQRKPSPSFGRHSIDDEICEAAGATN